MINKFDYSMIKHTFKAKTDISLFKKYVFDSFWTFCTYTLSGIILVRLIFTRLKNGSFSRVLFSRFGRF